MTYDDCIKAKVRLHQPAGFEPVELNKHLFDWQRHVVKWANDDLLPRAGK